MKPARPALALPNLCARLFERLLLEVIAFQQLPFFLRQLPNRRPHPKAHLLHLEPLIRRKLLVGNLQPICPFEAGGEHHRQPRHRTRDLTYIIVDRAPAVASLVSVSKVAKVGVGPLGHPLAP
jgi:hypothetical protein